MSVNPPARENARERTTSIPDVKTSRPAAETNVTSGSVTGKTKIDDAVVAKVAGIAARDADGVYALGSGTARAFGAIRGAMGQTDLTQGISVEVGEKQVAVDISLVVEYPRPIHHIVDSVRHSVYRAVQELVGLQVVEVNIAVSDIHVASDEPKDADGGSGPPGSGSSDAGSSDAGSQQGPRVR